MYNFFQKHSVLAKTQYGFQNNVTTCHAILDEVTNIYDQINNNEYKGAIFWIIKKLLIAFLTQFSCINLIITEFAVRYINL